MKAEKSDFSQRVETAVQFSGKQVTEIAKELDVQTQSIYNLISGNVKAPNIFLVANLCKSTGTSLTWMVEGKLPMEAGKEPTLWSDLKRNLESQVETLKMFNDFLVEKTRNGNFMPPNTNKGQVIPFIGNAA